MSGEAEREVEKARQHPRDGGGPDREMAVQVVDSGVAERFDQRDCLNEMTKTAQTIAAAGVVAPHDFEQRTKVAAGMADYGVRMCGDELAEPKREDVPCVVEARM
jgi:hypothetical protein